MPIHRVKYIYIPVQIVETLGSGSTQNIQSQAEASNHRKGELVI